MSEYATVTLDLMSETVGADRKGWVHLLPVGRFDGVDGRGPYVVKNPDQIIAASRKDAGQRQMVIDYDHSTDLVPANPRVRGEPVPAAGWITGMQSRKDGIWGLVEWTQRAADFIANREYRYLSPTFRRRETGEIVSILRAALTNTPNLDQLTALASAQEETMKPEIRNDITTLLGLDGQADDAAIVGKIRTLTEKIALQTQNPNPAEFVPIGDFQRAIAEVNKLRQGVSLQAAQERVDDDIRKGLILPWMKEWAVDLCSHTMPSYEKFIAGVGPGFSHLASRVVTGDPPNDRTKLTADENIVARNLGLTEEEFAAARSRN